MLNRTHGGPASGGAGPILLRNGEEARRPASQVFHAGNPAPRDHIVAAYRKNPDRFAVAEQFKVTVQTVRNAIVACNDLGVMAAWDKETKRNIGEATKQRKKRVRIGPVEDWPMPEGVTPFRAPEIDDATLQHETVSVAMEQLRREWRRHREGGDATQAAWALGQWRRLDLMRREIRA